MIAGAIASGHDVVLGPELARGRVGADARLGDVVAGPYRLDDLAQCHAAAGLVDDLRDLPVYRQIRWPAPSREAIPGAVCLDDTVVGDQRVAHTRRRPTFRAHRGDDVIQAQGPVGDGQNCGHQVGGGRRRGDDVFAEYGETRSAKPLLRAIG